jgi:hypothetical protein
MTISEDARALFDRLDLAREDLLLISKCVSQSIIADSKDADTPLSGMLYDVWGLYNDGSPKCRWTAPYENDDVVFSGQFRVEGSDAFVVRRKVLELSDLTGIIEEVGGEVNGGGVRAK